MIEVEDTKNIYLNSRHSTPNNGSIKSYKSNVVFPFKGLLVESEDTIYTHVEVINAQIPYSFYNISYTNNQLNYFINSSPGVLYSINVPYGNYNITQLIAQLTVSFLQNGGVVMQITYNKITGRLLFNSSVEISINTFDNTYSSGSSIYQILGFSENLIYPTIGKVLYSPFPSNLIPMEKIRICSQILSTNLVDKLTLNAVNIIASIPVTSPPFSMIQYENTGRRKSILKTRSIDNIDIRILDQENNPLNFNNSKGGGGGGGGDYPRTSPITTYPLFREAYDSAPITLNHPHIKPDIVKEKEAVKEDVPIPAKSVKMTQPNKTPVSAKTKEFTTPLPVKKINMEYVTESNLEYLKKNTPIVKRSYRQPLRAKDSDNEIMVGATIDSNILNPDYNSSGGAMEKIIPPVERIDVRGLRKITRKGRTDEQKARRKELDNIG